jgi:RHS repeat-associated protein
VNGTKSYLAADGLGSANVTLNSSGTATASQLYAPYGGVRYTNGTMPTSYGFTGQRADVTSGLDYYGARYYDPLAGQFTSGDSVLPGHGFDILGMSRYAYVEGKPIVRTDPSGHVNVTIGSNGGACNINDPSCGGGTSSGGTGPCWMTGGNCVTNWGSSGSPPWSSASGGSAQPTPTPGPAPAPPTGTASIPVIDGVAQFWSNFTAPAQPEALACEPGDGVCYHWYDSGYQDCIQSGRCTTIMRGGVETDISEPPPTLTFDQAREQAFKLAGMTDPSQVRITKYDPVTGTAVEFSGPGGAKVAYDGPHAQPGPGHDYPHIGWQTAGKKSQPGFGKGNITYKGPAGPVRGRVTGWEEWGPVDEVVP